jgi:hypothetical protein
MSTRSRIGIELKNGSILSCYHHWDSYPEWLGRILKTHYNSRSLAAELIDGGDMSSCWTDERWTGDRWGAYPTKAQEYGPQYYSQRGENCPPRLDADLCEYLLPDNSEEFAYIFRAGEWVCYNMHEFDEKLPEVVEIPSAALAC